VEYRKTQIWSENGCLPDLGSGVVWCQVWPNHLEPGAWGEIKFSVSSGVPPPAAVQISCALAGESQSLVASLPDRPSHLEWQAITFTPDLRRMWFGIRSRAASQSRLTSIRVNGEERIGEAVGCVDLRPESVTVVGIPLIADCSPGDDVFLIVRDDRDECAVARVRVNNRFPIFAWTESPAGLDLDPTPFFAENDATPISYSQLMSCVTHNHGTYAEAALKLAGKYASLRKQSTSTLGCIYLCYFRWQDGLTVFPPLVDLAITYPVQGLPHEGNPESVKSENTFASTAFRGSAPGGWIAYMSVTPINEAAHLRQRAPSREELMYMIWECIGYGARGVLYGGSEEQLRAADIGIINREIRDFLPSLTYAIPTESLELAEGKARVAVLQAGLDELIVIVINNAMTYSTEVGSPSLYQLLRDLRVEIEIPPGLMVDDTRQGCEPVEVGEHGQTCAFSIERLKREYVTRIGLRKGQ
jgi:hypothetical protein